MVKRSILKSGQLGLFKRLEGQIFTAINACLALWFLLSIILILFKDIKKPSFHVWAGIIGTVIGLVYIFYKSVYTFTRSKDDKISFVLNWYIHRADKAKHKLKFGLETGRIEDDPIPSELDQLLPSWALQKKRQILLRKIFVVMVVLTTSLVFMAPWKKAFSEVFGSPLTEKTFNSIQWISKDSCVIGSTYQLKAFVNDTGSKAGKLYLNGLIINPLWNNDTLTYTINTVDQELDFSWKEGIEVSSTFNVKLTYPRQSNISVKITPPEYTNQEITEHIKPRNLEIIEGSHLLVKDPSKAEVKYHIVSDKAGTYKNSLMVVKSAKYFICEGRDTVSSIDINVRKDQRPQISMAWNFDSTLRVYTAIGSFKDDFGINSVHRKVNYIQSNRIIQEKTYNVIHDKGVEGEFVDYFRRRELWKSGIDAIEVYYTICDNNNVKGNQCVLSEKVVLNVPNQDTWDTAKIKELQEMEEVANEISSSQSKVNENLDEIRNNRLTESTSSTDNQNLLDFLEEIENLSDQKRLLKEELESFQLMAREIESDLDTTQLNALLEQATDEDKRSELLNKIREALEKEDDNSLNEALEELGSMQEQEEMSLEMLERMLAQLLQEQALNEAIESLKELSEKQRQLELHAEDVIDQQEDINTEFKEIEESIKSGKDMLGEESPSIQESTKSLSNDLNQLQQNIQEGNSSESEKQGASEKMKELSNMLSMAMKSAQQKQLEMDLATLQQLLENLVDLSLIEEDLFLLKSENNRGTYTKERKLRSQNLWVQSFDNVKDTLLSMAARNPSAQKPIMEGIFKIEKSLRYLGESFERTNERVWSSRAQAVMMNVNEMALILDEALQNIQMNLSGQMQGNQMCENPGGSGKGESGKPSKEGSLKDIMSDQAAMGDQGKDQGKGKNGKSGGGEEGEAGDKALAQLIKQQAKIRNKLEQWLKENNLEKSGSGALEEMRRQEQRLAEGILETTPEYTQGLQNIELQLLKLNEAANKQGNKETRKSTEAQNRTANIVPDDIQQKINQILQRQMSPQKENPGLVSFYEKLWQAFTQ